MAASVGFDSGGIEVSHSIRVDGYHIERGT